MNIEIGKTYHVSPVYKKSFVEQVQFARDPSSSVSVDKLSHFLLETSWRGGSVGITISTDDEREILQDALLFEDSCSELMTEDFEEVEFLDCSDVWDEQIYCEGRGDEDISLIVESMLGHPSVHQWSEDNGFEATDTSYALYGPLEIEEFNY